MFIYVYSCLCLFVISPTEKLHLKAKLTDKNNICKIYHNRMPKQTGTKL